MSQSDTDWVEARAVTSRSTAFRALRSCLERCVQRWDEVHAKYDNLPTDGSFEFIHQDGRLGTEFRVRGTIPEYARRDGEHGTEHKLLTFRLLGDIAVSVETQSGTAASDFKADIAWDRTSDCYAFLVREHVPVGEGSEFQQQYYSPEELARRALEPFFVPYDI